jgi:hypothetical protein
VRGERMPGVAGRAGGDRRRRLPGCWFIRVHG